MAARSLHAAQADVTRLARLFMQSRRCLDAKIFSLAGIMHLGMSSILSEHYT